MISKEEILKIAKLSRLNLNQSEQDHFSEQFSAILDYFEQMAKIDTSGVEPLITPTEIELHWREDEAKTWNVGEQVIEQAPDKSGRLFKVPPVVG